ncbi:MAG: DUF2892 domain-containing protein [Gammaproteobacteria bacterium]
MHQIDRIVRLVAGLTCIYIGFVDSSLISSQPVSIVVGIFGTINLWAFITSRCPVYSAAGFSTAIKRQQTAES